VNNPRVKILVIAVAALAVGYILDQVLIEPLVNRLSAANKALANAQKELNDINSKLAIRQPLQRKIDAVRAEVAKRDVAKIQSSVARIVGKMNSHSAPEKPRTKNFSELEFAIEGDGTIETVVRTLYDLTYHQDYLRVRKPTLTARENGRIHLTLTASVLMAKAPAKAEGGGLSFPDRPSFDKFKMVVEKNIFQPFGVVVAPPTAPTPPKRTVEVRASGFVMMDGVPVAILESQGKSTFVKKGDKYGKYSVVEVKKQDAQSQVGEKDQVTLARDKGKPVVIHFDETVKILHEDEVEDEVPSK
jgi:hypothetical protein